MTHTFDMKLVVSLNTREKFVPIGENDSRPFVRRFRATNV